MVGGVHETVWWVGCMELVGGWGAWNRLVGGVHETVWWVGSIQLVGGWGA